MTEPEPTRCLSPAQVADLLACSAAHVRELCRTGDLPAVRHGTRYSIPVAAYEQWLADRTHQPTT